MASRVETNLPPKVSGLTGRICLGVSKLFLKDGRLRRFGFRRPEITRFDSMDNWVSDRVEQISEYQELFSKYVDFHGKTVLEVGCNQGYLLNSFLKHEQFNAIGADLNEAALEAAKSNFGDRIRFVRSTPESIPLDDESVDIIYCIDTVEHLSAAREIFIDCHRILKPGGTLLVHFGGWLTPYGSHLEDIIPIPWANTFFSMDTLLDVAAHLYDSPDYQVACYYLDEKTGAKKPNPFLDKEGWRIFLNQMTIRKFRKLLRELPFEVAHFENIGFGGKSFKAGRLLGKLSRFPVGEEFFSKATFAVLRRQANVVG